ncbi:MAG: DUF445 domain-containing protein [Actinobacteria bacterium]|nr:DUF445 domain-containing protein [Actinomycetota bacterium]
MPAPVDDEAARLAALRRTKRQATGLLLAATAVFVATRLLEDRMPWIAYVRATAEAAMVGALADWFAVTALFRHPLGIPIPHTAIVPNRKDDIGRGLGTFVERHFLTREVVEERLRATSVAARLGAWLADPAHAERAGEQAVTVLRSVVEALRDDEVQGAIEAAVAQRLRRLDPGPVLSRAIEVGMADGRHHQVVSLLVTKLGDIVDANREELRARLRSETPWWVPDTVDDRIFNRAYASIHRFLDEVGADPEHPVRRQIDERLHELATGLVQSMTVHDRLEELTEELVARPELREWSASVWADLKRSVLERAADPQSALRRRVSDSVAGFGARLRDDPLLQAKVDDWVVGMAGDLVEQSRGEVGEVIAATVARWDPQESSRRIELQVGRDLQFIRINGTVVGGLAGLVIFTVGRLLGGS